jgi:LL-diaminopimelate aminotransferase
MPILFTFVYRTIHGRGSIREELSHWVDYAREHEALLLFDAAYEAYISQPNIPRSIFEIPGARECAVGITQFFQERWFHGRALRFTVMSKSLLARTGVRKKKCHCIPLASPLGAPRRTA